jgi:hypothetical protein
MEVVEMRVRYQNQIDGRQVTKIDSRLPQPLEHEEPTGEIGIDHYVLPCDLQEETGMANEGDA